MSNVSSNIPAPSKAIDASPPTLAKQAKWGPTAAIVISILAFLTGFLLAGIVVYGVAGLLGNDTGQSTDWIASVHGQFVFVFLAEGLLIGTILLFLRHRKASVKDLGFYRGPRLNDLGLAVVGFIVYFVALIIASAIAETLLHVNVDQKQELGFDSVVTSGEMIVTFVSLVVLPPIAEEILFRGFLYTGMRKRLAFLPTAIVVSLVFAFLHLFESSEGLLWIAGIDTLLLSLVLCYLRERTGNLWAPIAVHALKNSLAFLFLYVIATG